ncbi:MAG: hypothetical protein JNK68_08365 [Betaproteobacteria bacterium]|nr:hypothetical protein [Betaproteobacteria bacterium]
MEILARHHAVQTTPVSRSPQRLPAAVVRQTVHADVLHSHKPSPGN